MKIKVLIADSQLLVREGIRSLLSKTKDIQVVGEVQEGKELSSKISKMKPDVVIIDYHLPGFFEIDDIKMIHKNFPDTNIMIVTANQHKNDILKVLEYGVNNYILKLCDKEEFLNAVYASAKKEKFFCGKVVDAILEKHFPKKEHCEAANLTPREVEIIKLISEGLTNGKIAQKLYLSIHTVSTHRKNILKKLGLNNTSELIMYSIKTGIIQTSDK
ncbi:MAG: response regulator transcription factor [Bacteroidota bacterium]